MGGIRNFLATAVGNRFEYLPALKEFRRLGLGGGQLFVELIDLLSVTTMEIRLGKKGFNPAGFLFRRQDLCLDVLQFLLFLE